jgi:hypothetical protein
MIWCDGGGTTLKRPLQGRNNRLLGQMLLEREDSIRPMKMKLRRQRLQEPLALQIPSRV